MAEHVCIQEPSIKVMDARQVAMDSRTVAMSAKLDRISDALEALAVQKNDIVHLTRRFEDLRVWTGDHEKRIKALELAPGKSASALVYMAIGAGMTALGGVATGVTLFFMIGG